MSGNNSNKNQQRNNLMNVITQYRNLKQSQRLDSEIEVMIEELEKFITVESAVVTVERTPSEHPPVRVKIFIETPGPDIEVQALDYTPPAALIKVQKALQKRIDFKIRNARCKGTKAPRPARAVRRVGSPRWNQ